MKTGRLIRIGLLFACSIIILFWGINFLKGKKLLQKEKLFYAEYSKIGGLTKSSPVVVNGLSIGSVRDITLNNFKTGKIMVKFVITYPELEIPLGSEAKIISTDLMGTKAIEILLADTSLFHSYEDTLHGLIEGDLKDQVNTQMLPLKRSAEDLMSSMDSVLFALQMVFGPDNRDNLARSFESVSQTIQNLEKTSIFLDTYVKKESEKFSFILSNADSISSGLNNRSKDLHQIVTNIAGLSDTLNQLPLKEVATNLHIVLSDLHELFGAINQGEGNLGKLSQDDSLYNSLNSAADNLNHLINDIRLNPRRYIHISAFDRGRTIIASDDSELLDAINSESEMEYFVCITESPGPLPSDDSLFKKFKKLSFVQVENVYYYYIKETKSLDQAQRILSKNKSSYPDAGLFTWLNGKWHQIEF